MKFFVLAILFCLHLFGADKCIACHEKQSLLMTSECTTCHTETTTHQKNPEEKTAPVTLQNYQHFYNDDKPIVRSYQGLLQQEYGSKKYFHMQADIHFQKGMICQDCHSSSELHSDGFWQGKVQSKVSCEDCHGTTELYPWELDQNKTALANMMKKEEMLYISLVSGESIGLKPLKLLKKSKALSKEALVAMDNITGHRENVACSACHTLWAPQFYGSQDKNGTKTSLFTRWEEPFLMQNKDHKIVPAVPKTSKQNRENILRSTIPHTLQKESRSCESCHNSQKVLSGSVDLGMFQDKNITHFNLSKVFTQAQRDQLDRRGVCLSCHDSIPNGTLAVSTISHISQMMQLEMDEKKHQTILKRILNMSAWFQIILVLFVVFIFIYIIYTSFIKKRSINPRNKGWK